MNKYHKFFFITFLLVLLNGSALLSQGMTASQGAYPPGLNLNSDQLNQIQDLRMQFQKETLVLRNELQTRFLELRSLYYRGADQGPIDAARDEINVLQEQLDDRFMTHRNSIRNILNDGQKALFDRWGGLGLGAGAGMGYGFGAGYGRGFGRGAGYGRGAGFNRRGGAGYGYGNAGFGRGSGYGRGWGMSAGAGRGAGYNRGWRCPGLWNR